MKNYPLFSFRKAENGFTLIEIIIVLVLLGILAATATFKYLDVIDTAKQKTAQATVAEAQARSNLLFAEVLLKTGDCTTAETTAQKIGNIADTKGSNKFNQYTLSTADGTFQPKGTAVSVYDEKNSLIEVENLYLYGPTCAGNSNPGSEVITDLLARLMAGGNSADGGTHTGGSKMTGTLPNGVKYSWWGISTANSPLNKATLEYTDAQGNILMTMELRYKKDGSDSNFYIGALGINSKSNNYVNDQMNINITQEKVDTAKKVMNQIGLDFNKFSNVIQAGTTNIGTKDSMALISGHTYNK